MLVRTLLTVAMFACASGAAWAHSPYFTQIEKIDLADGTQGELRLLHGDGIMVSDPVRVIAIDNQKRLIALSEHGFTASIVCQASRKCLGYLDGRILELKAATQPGPVIADALQNAEKRWELEGSKQSFGFVARDARFSEELAANFAVAKETPVLVAIHTALGAFSAMAIAGLVLVPLKRGRVRWSVFGAVLALIAVSGLAAVSIFFMLIATLPDLLWVGSVMLGFALVFLLMSLIRRKPRPA